MEMAKGIHNMFNVQRITKGSNNIWNTKETYMTLPLLPEVSFIFCGEKQIGRTMELKF